MMVMGCYSLFGSNNHFGVTDYLVVQQVSLLHDVDDLTVERIVSHRNLRNGLMAKKRSPWWTPSYR